MRMPDNKNAAWQSFFTPAKNALTFVKGWEEAAQRKCAHCEEEEKLQRKEISSQPTETSSETSTYINSLSSKGSSLPESARSFFESRFEHAFSHVKIHNDSEAAKSADSINALAYTSGNNIVFNQNQFSPESGSGRKLLAHELTHVVQQSTNDSIISRQVKPENLDSEKRTALVGGTRGRITTCASYFKTDLLEVKIKVGKMLEEQKASSDALFEIAFGLLMPGLGKILGKGLAALANAIPESASTITYRGALALLDEKRTKELFVKATEIGQKAAKISFDSELKSITGNPTYEEFFTKLNTSAATGFDHIQTNLESKTDEELGVLFLSYDPTVADFVRQIENLFFKFRKQVEPIGKETEDRYGPILARWVEGTSWKALALTGEGRYYNVGGRPQFITWISPEMKNSALESTIKIRGMIDTVHYKGIEATPDEYTTFDSLLNNYDSVDRYGKIFTLEKASGTVHAPSTTPCIGCHGESEVRDNPQLPFILTNPPQFILISPERQKQLIKYILLSNSK